MSSSASDEQTLEMAEKTFRPTAFKQEKIKEYKYYNNTLMTQIIHGRGMKTDIDTGKSGITV